MFPTIVSAHLREKEIFTFLWFLDIVSLPVCLFLPLFSFLFFLVLIEIGYLFKYQIVNSISFSSLSVLAGGGYYTASDLAERFTVST